MPEKPNEWKCIGKPGAEHDARTLCRGENCPRCGASSPDMMLAEAADTIARLRAQLDQERGRRLPPFS